MRNKILSFITYKKKLLALRNNPSNLKHGGNFWFTLTGNLEKGETHEEAVKRELKEETGLNILHLLPLNWGSIYKNRNKLFKELDYISFVDSNKIKLSEEHIEYKWLNLEDFIKKIDWFDDKKLLKRILIKALYKKIYFNKLSIINYMEKD